MALENYDLTIDEGRHVVKVHFQAGKHKSYVTFPLNGNAKGASVLSWACDPDTLYDVPFIENPAELRFVRNESRMTLFDSEGCGIPVNADYDYDNLGDYIVGVEITEFIRSEDL